MDNSARKINLAKFKKHKARVLVVTDVAARGIDLPQLDFVINYDFPHKPKLFVHRVGRTARAGRSGAAISILQPDELAYLLDLQLFLATTKVQPVLNGQPNGIHGRLPSRQLQMYHEAVLQSHNTNSSLAGSYQSLINAVKLYRETRVAPSPASVAKAKLLLTESGGSENDTTIRLEVHPMFSGLIDKAEAAAEDFITKLKGFRPNQTIFEVEKQKGNIVGSKKTNKNKGPVSSVESSHLRQTVLKIRGEKQRLKELGDTEKAAVSLAETTAKNLKKRKAVEMSDSSDFSDDESSPVVSEAKRPKFEDDKFFMKMAPTDANQAIERGLSITDGKGSGNLEDMLLELAPDDDRSIFRKRSLMKWDQRKRKFIRDDTDDKKKAKQYIRTESGQRIKAAAGTSGKMYKDWMEKTKKRIPSNGEQEQGGSEVTPRSALPYKHWQNKKQDSGAKGGYKGRPAPRDEVRSRDQIKKTRQDEAKKKQREEHWQKERAKTQRRKGRD
jgi:ATP-dependent RNA helicase DDX54/DBP10